MWLYTMLTMVHMWFFFLFTLWSTWIFTLLKLWTSLCNRRFFMVPFLKYGLVIYQHFYKTTAKKRLNHSPIQKAFNIPQALLAIWNFVLFLKKLQMVSNGVWEGVFIILWISNPFEPHNFFTNIDLSVVACGREVFS